MAMKNNDRAQKRAQREERKREIEQRIAEAIKIVQTGSCPQCGSGLRRNLSLTGWWQCEQYGSKGFRKNDDAPECSFQTFTA